MDFNTQKDMKGIYTLILMFLIPLSSWAQSIVPTDWTGIYKGTLDIYKKDTIAHKVKMVLEINAKVKDSVFDWKISYDFKGETDVREYEIILQDRKKGYYLLDEKNSIFLDGYLNLNVLTFFYNVMDSFLVTEYTFNKDDSITFDLISGLDQPNISGEGVEEVPKVLSYPINGRQKAKLVKVPD